MNTNRPSLSIFPTARRTTLVQELSPSYQKMRKHKTELLPLDCYLRRNDILSLDKQTRAKNVLKQGKDISYYYDSIVNNSPLTHFSSEKSQYELPVDLEGLRKISVSEEYKSENLLKRSKENKPYGRKDAENLIEWVDLMHSKFLFKLDSAMENNEILTDEETEKVELVYVTALKEITKQITTHCMPRAEVLKKAFEVLEYTWKRPQHRYQANMDSMAKSFSHEIDRIKSESHKHYNKLLIKNQDLVKQTDEQYRERELLQNEIHIIRKFINTVTLENDSKTTQMALKNPVEVATQTENFDSETSEENSDESGKVDEEPILTPFRIISRHQTMVQEKRPEHLKHLREHLELAGCTESFSGEELYQYITKDYCDFYAWVDGFRLATEFFKTKIERVVENKENEVNESECASPRLRKIEEKKRLFRETKIINFEFKPNVTIAQYINENSPIDYILTYLSTQNLKKICKISCMAFRKLSIQVTNYINIARVKGIEQFPSFSIMVYTEIFQKYSLKPIANRKFKELVACCIKHSTDNKIQVFLRMLGGGQGVGLSTFSNVVCKMAIKIYEFMNSDKTGIILENYVSSDSMYYPTARAYECIRQMHEPYLTKHEILRLTRKVELLSKADPDDINKSGLIELHAFVIVAIEALQEYSDIVCEGVKLVTSVLTDFNYVTWEEINVIVRNICPKKELKESDKLSIVLDRNDECDIAEFTNFCIVKGILRLEDAQKFFKQPILRIDIIVDMVNAIKEDIEEKLEKCQGVIPIMSIDDWEGRLDDVVFGIRGKSATKAYMLWELLQSEYTYISKITD